MAQRARTGYPRRGESLAVVDAPPPVPDPPTPAPPAPADALVPGTIAWLPPTALVTADYQRTLRMTRVKRMARDFDTRLLKVLLITEREGSLYLIDGQHRAAAAIEAGRAEVPLPCLVVSTDSYADEAELFVKANDRALNSPVTTGEIFYARLEQGDPVALGIRQIVQSMGLVLDLQMNLSSQADGMLRAIATLQRIYRQGGADQLRDVLETVMGAYGNERAAYSHHILSGFHQFIYRYHALLERKHLQAVCRNVTVDGLHARMLMRRVSDGVSGADLGLTLARVILQLYNEQLPPKQQLPDWKRTAGPNKATRTLPGEAYSPRPATFVEVDEDLASYGQLIRRRRNRED